MAVIHSSSNDFISFATFLGPGRYNPPPLSWTFAPILKRLVQPDIKINGNAKNIFCMFSPRITHRASATAGPARQDTPKGDTAGKVWLKIRVVGDRLEDLVGPLFGG